MSQRPHLHFRQRYEARLLGLHHGDDWDTMCKTTPIVINGVHFDHPMTCEDRVRASWLRRGSASPTILIEFVAEWQNWGVGYPTQFMPMIRPILYRVPCSFSPLAAKEALDLVRHTTLELERVPPRLVSDCCSRISAVSHGVRLWSC